MSTVSTNDETPGLGHKPGRLLPIIVSTALLLVAALTWYYDDRLATWLAANDDRVSTVYWMFSHPESLFGSASETLAPSVLYGPVGSVMFAPVLLAETPDSALRLYVFLSFAMTVACVLVPWGCLARHHTASPFLARHWILCLSVLFALVCAVPVLRTGIESAGPDVPAALWLVVGAMASCGRTRWGPAVAALAVVAAIGCKITYVLAVPALVGFWAQERRWRDVKVFLLSFAVLLGAALLALQWIWGIPNVMRAVAHVPSRQPWTARTMLYYAKFAPVTYALAAVLWLAFKSIETPQRFLQTVRRWQKAAVTTGLALLGLLLVALLVLWGAGFTLASLRQAMADTMHAGLPILTKISSEHSDRWMITVVGGGIFFACVMVPLGAVLFKCHTPPALAERAPLLASWQRVCLHLCCWLLIAGVVGLLKYGGAPRALFASSVFGLHAVWCFVAAQQPEAEARQRRFVLGTGLMALVMMMAQLQARRQELNAIQAAAPFPKDDPAGYRAMVEHIKGSPGTAWFPTRTLAHWFAGEPCVVHADAVWCHQLAGEPVDVRGKLPPKLESAFVSASDLKMGTTTGIRVLFAPQLASSPETSAGFLKLPCPGAELDGAATQGLKPFMLERQ